MAQPETTTAAEDSVTPVRRRYRRELVSLAIAGILFVVAAAGSTLTAGLPEGEDGFWPLIPRDEVLRNGPLGPRAVAGDVEGSSAYRLLSALQPLDAAVHLAGLEFRRDSAAPPPIADEERLSARHQLRPQPDLRTILRRGGNLFAWRAVEESLVAEQERLEATPSLFPTRGYISSGFSRARRHPILELTRSHKGLDIVAPTGTPIVAAARGRVRLVAQHLEYGRMVEIDHGYGVVTRYAHASRTLVRRGQLVERGDTIAHVGMTGLAIGPHLHYEVLVDGVPANPNRYVFDLNVISD